MRKYQQKKEDGVEASSDQESLEGNNMVHIDIPEGFQRSESLPIFQKCADVDMQLIRENHSRAIKVEELSSKSETDASEVQEHNENMNFGLLKEAYDLIKGGNAAGPAWWNRDTIDTSIFQQKIPLGNTVLHMAATYDGSSSCADSVAKKAPELLNAKNFNHNTALHVAAAAGNISFLHNLLTVHLYRMRYSNHECIPDALNEILAQNKQGNTFIHEALLNDHKDVMNFLFSRDDSSLVLYKAMVVQSALFRTNKQEKSILYLAIEAGFKEVVEALITRNIIPPSEYKMMFKFVQVIPPNVDPSVTAGKSPFLAAILKQNREILNLLISKVPPTWLRDIKGRTPLHFAASIGYLDGVHDLLNKCVRPCQVVQELLRKEYCLDPRELLDNTSRNFLHLAAASGKFSVLRYILRSDHNELVEMINDKDDNGNTPLHLATMRCHPKVVHALTWDRRVKLRLVNGDNQTALDVCMQTSLQNPSLSQRLTWLALKSADVPYADPYANSIKVPSQETKSLWEKEAPNMDQYKDRINTLIVVSTLIITLTFAAGFTLPGGAKSSDPGEGMALMLHRMWFKLFIFCITISMYGSISVTIILIWAQLGDLTMAILALNVAKYCLGVILATLSLAFMAGVHLVISDLSWLSSTALAMSFTFIFMLMLLYLLIWLPSMSTKTIVRYISYYPFRMLASLVEYKEKAS